MSSAGRRTAGLAAWFSTCASLASVAMAAVMTPAAPRPQPAPELVAPEPPVESVPAPAAGLGNGDYLALQNRYVMLFQQVKSAVVEINADSSSGPINDGKTHTYFWTGFFINRNGYLLTANANVLQGALRIWIIREKTVYLAEAIGLDPVTNLAVLHVLKLPKEFGVLDLRANTALPPVGSLLLGITCKLNQPPSPVAGMLQGYNINYADHFLPTLHLRVNIPDDGGEEGAPILDLAGHLAGVMIVALRDSRASLALPASAAYRVCEDLLNLHHAAYGRLGLGVHEIGDAESGSGVMIDSVEYGGPAQTAGLKVGDLLLSVGGAAIHGDEDLRQAAFFSRPGQNLVVHVRRDNQELELSLQAGEMSAAPSPPAGPSQPPAPSSPPTDIGSGAAPSILNGNDTGAPPPPVEKLTK